MQQNIVKEPITQLYRFKIFKEKLNDSIYHSRRSKKVFSVVKIQILFFDNLNIETQKKIILQISHILKKYFKRQQDIISYHKSGTFFALLPYTISKNTKTLCAQIENHINQKKIIHPHSPLSKYITVYQAITAWNQFIDQQKILKQLEKGINDLIIEKKENIIII